MKAMVVQSKKKLNGSSKVFQQVDMPKPTITQADQLLIQVFAAGVNPVDTKLRANGLYFPDPYPAILGCDGAGVVEAVGADVSNFQAGDPVYYCYGGLGQQVNGQSVGNYGEYVLVPESFVAAKPETLGYLQAAGAPLVLITAWEALFDRVGLRSGQKVLVQGGAGGVGHVAIQLAKIAGCEVATTVSSDEKAAFVRDLGADHVMNYTREDLCESLLTWSGGAGVDVVFETVGKTALNELLPAMAHYAHYVTLLQLPDDLDMKALRLKNITLSQELMLTPMVYDLKEAAEHQAAILEECGQLIDTNQLKLHISKVLPLEAVGDAHALIEAGHTQGKIVLAIAGDEAV